MNLELEDATDLQAIVANKLGQVVRENNFGALPKGFNSLEFELGDLPAGQYYLSLRSKTGVQSIPVVVLGRP